MVRSWIGWGNTHCLLLLTFFSLCFPCNRLWLPLSNNIQLHIHSPHCLSTNWSPRIRSLPNLDLYSFQLHVPFGGDRQWPSYGSGGLGQEPPWTHVFLPGHAGTQWCSSLYCHSTQNASYLLAGPFLINVSCVSHTDVFCSCSVHLWVCCSIGHGFWPLCGDLCTTPLCNLIYRLSH